MTAMGSVLDGITPVDSIDDVSTQAVLDALPGNYTDDDVIRGSETDDHLLSGGKGNDVLIGGKGSDTFAGGEGNDDVIQINLADSSADRIDVDVVTDLSGGDRIVAADLLVDDGGDLTALLPVATSDGSSVELDSNGVAPGGVVQEVVIANVSP
jgi:Ca2+-binding RTX toxin-like protein